MIRAHNRQIRGSQPEAGSNNSAGVPSCFPQVPKSQKLHCAGALASGVWPMGSQSHRWPVLGPWAFFSEHAEFGVLVPQTNFGQQAHAELLGLKAVGFWAVKSRCTLLRGKKATCRGSGPQAQGAGAFLSMFFCLSTSTSTHFWTTSTHEVSWP